MPPMIRGASSAPSRSSRGSICRPVGLRFATPTARQGAGRAPDRITGPSKAGLAPTSSAPSASIRGKPPASSLTSFSRSRSPSRAPVLKRKPTRAPSRAKEPAPRKGPFREVASARRSRPARVRDALAGSSRMSLPPRMSMRSNCTSRAPSPMASAGQPPDPLSETRSSGSSTEASRKRSSPWSSGVTESSSRTAPVRRVTARPSPREAPPSSRRGVGSSTRPMEPRVVTGAPTACDNFASMKARCAVQSINCGPTSARVSAAMRMQARMVRLSRKGGFRTEVGYTLA